MQAHSMLFYSYFKTLVGKQVGKRGLLLSARNRRGTHRRNICHVANPRRCRDAAMCRKGTSGQAAFLLRPS